MATHKQIMLYEDLLARLCKSDEEAAELSGIDYDQFDLLDARDASDVIGALLTAERDSERN